MKCAAVFFACLLPTLVPACELCTISSAENAYTVSGTSPSKFIFSVSEQYIPFNKLQVEGEPFPRSPFFQAAYLNSSITHFVPGYNFTPRLGLSVNVPLVYRQFHRTEVTPLGERIDERGTLTGLGDVALVGRWTAFQKSDMDYALNVNLLAGVKFPTGDTERLEDEQEQERRYTEIFGPVHAHSYGGIHQHDLSPGTGSVDGVFGLTANARWKRVFFNSQGQYYVRGTGLDYRVGDLIIVSGGPGFYALLLDNTATVSIQANAIYEHQSSDLSLGQVNNQTGFEAWYFGPLVSFTWGEHFSGNIGVDMPLSIYNHGIQSVPDYRIHGGLNWKF